MFWQSRNDFLDEEIVFLPHTLIYCLMASCQTDNSSEKQRHHHVFWFSVCFTKWPVWITFFVSHLLDLARCSASCFYVPSLPFLLGGQTRKYLSNSPSRQVVPLIWKGTCSKRIRLSNVKGTLFNSGSDCDAYATICGTNGCCQTASLDNKGEQIYQKLILDFERLT